MGDWREELRTLGESFLQVVSELHGRTYPVHVSQLAIAVRDVLALQERVNCWMESGLRKERTRRIELERRLQTMELSVARARDEETSWRKQVEKGLVDVGTWRGDFETRMRELKGDTMERGMKDKRRVSDEEGLKRKSFVLRRDCFDECEDDLLAPHSKPLGHESDPHEDGLQKRAETLPMACRTKRMRMTPTRENKPIEQVQGLPTANNIPCNASALDKHAADQKNNPQATPDVQLAKRPRTNIFNKQISTAQAVAPPASPIAPGLTAHRLLTNNKAPPAAASITRPVPPALSSETPLTRLLPPLPRTDQVLQDQARRQAERRAKKRLKPLPCAKCRLRKRAIMLREKGYVNEEVFERWANKPGACLGNVHQDEPPESSPSPLSFEETETESPNNVR